MDASRVTSVLRSTGLGLVGSLLCCVSLVQGATFSISPASVSNTYTGSITLQIGGLTNGEAVRIDKYLDANTNGVVDAGDWLVQSLMLKDGQAPMVIGGVTNINVPYDSNSASGTITVSLNFLTASIEQKFVGKYLWILSSPTGRFSPVTNSFAVANAAYAQAITGKVQCNNTNIPNAGIVVFPSPSDNGPIAATVADSSGAYTIKLPCGTYSLWAFKSNYIGDQAVAPVITLTSGSNVSSNLSVFPATRTISGRIVDAANTGIGLPGVLLCPQTTNELIAICFTGTNGNFAVPVTAGVWDVNADDAALTAYGYLGLNDGVSVDTTTGNVSGVTVAFPKVNALFYGCLKDSMGNPVAGIDVEAYDNNNSVYDADVNTDVNGNYVIGVLGGMDNPAWQIKADAEINPYQAHYIFSQPDFESDGGGTNISVNAAEQINLAALLATNTISGTLVDHDGNPIAGVGIWANATIAGLHYSLWMDTDKNGNYAFCAANGSWTVGVDSWGGDESLPGTYFPPANQTVVIADSNAVENFTVWTVGVADVTTYFATKGQTYSQPTSDAPSAAGAMFHAEVDEAAAGTVLSAAIQPPVGDSLTLLPNAANTMFTADVSFASLDDLDSSYPDGSYTSTINGVHDGTKTSTLTLTGDLYPNPPQVSNWTATQTIVPNRAFLLTWYSFADGSPLDFIQVGIYDTNGVIVFQTPNYGVPLALNGTNTSVAIPANTLVPGKNYFGSLMFGKGVAANTTDYAGAFGGGVYFAQTMFPMATALLPVITTTALSVGTSNVTYNSQQLAASGGQPPYRWSLASGSLPAGLSLSTNGVVSGKPTAVGTSSFVVQVTDNNAETAVQALSLTIYPFSTSVAFSVSPNSVSNTYAGKITLQITGLVTGETVRVDKYLDANTNGVVDASDWLVQSLVLTDGQAPMIIGGVTNSNVPYDSNQAGGVITASMDFRTASIEQKFVGKQLCVVSSPTGRFAPVTNAFVIVNTAYAQWITGKVQCNGTNVPNAGVLVFPPSSENGGAPTAGTVSDGSGTYTINVAPGEHAVWAFKRNFVCDQGKQPIVSVHSSSAVSTNLNLIPATQTIFGTCVDSANASIGLPGVLVCPQSTSNLIAIGFTDINGNFAVPVTASGWTINSDDTGLACYGYVGLDDGPVVDTTTGNVSGVTIAFSKVNALCFGSVKDNFGNPLAGVDVGLADDNNVYATDVYTDVNGNYVAGVVGGLGDDLWNAWAGNSSDSYIYTQPNVDTNISANTAVRIDFAALLATNTITGSVRDDSGNPIVNVWVWGHTMIDGVSYDLGVDTDDRGDYSLCVVNGEWTVGLDTSDDSDSLPGIYLPPGSQTVEITDSNAVVNFIAEQRPTITITAPATSQRIVSDSGVFNVMGTAADNSGVAAVFCQVNNDGWQQAVGTNFWSAAVTLDVGANTISAFSMDAAGNSSPTASVTCAYVVAAPITIQTTGSGTCGVYTNGQLLDLNQTYVLTATPGTGFVFTNWTSGVGGSQLTTASSINFTMVSNLVLCANFLADVQNPTVAIVSPTVFQVITATNTLLVASGTAADNGSLSAVVCQLNKGGWASATGTDAWTFRANMLEGTNTLQAYSVDTAGNCSTTSSVTFTYVAVTARMTVQMIGLGTVFTNYDNQTLDVGQSYTMTAYPGAGFAFSNWTYGTNGLVATNAASITFTMVSNLVLCANFIDVQKPMVTIATPTANQAINRTDTSVLVTGTATDNVGIAAIQVQLNSGAWTLVAGTNAWSTTVNATMGVNTARVFSTDAAGNSSPTATVTFTLFVDVTKPTLNITTPYAAQRISSTNAQLTITGTAFDNSSWWCVLCQLNNGGWAPASGTNAWTFTTENARLADVNFSMVPGSNTLQAFSEDGAGNCSSTQTVTFTYVVLTPITISKMGNGTIGGCTNGQLLEVGTTYTLTATPASGNMFSNWTAGAAGDLITNTMSYTFTMVPGLNLCANFGVSAGLLRIYGTYDGSLFPTTNLMFETIVGIVETQQVLLANEGNVAIHITSMTALSAYREDKTVLTLAPGSNAVLTIFFQPSVAGTSSNLLAITSPDAAVGSDTALLLTSWANPDLTGRWAGQWTGTNLPGFTVCLKNMFVSVEQGESLVVTSGKMFGPDAATNYYERTFENGSVYNGNLIWFSLYNTTTSGPAAYYCAMTGTVVNTTITGLCWTEDGALRRPFTLTRQTTAPYVDMSGSWTNVLWVNAVQIQQTADQFVARSYGTDPMDGYSEDYKVGWITNFNQFAGWNYTSTGELNTNGMMTGTFDGANTINGLAAPDSTGTANQFQLKRLVTAVPTVTIPFASPAGLLALSEFFYPEKGTVADTGLVAQAATAFASAAAASTVATNPNHIYNALSIMLNLINDPTLRAQLQACGVDLDDLSSLSVCFPTNNAPAVNDTIDKLWASAQPAIDKAFNELNLVPSTWTGPAVFSPSELPIDETIYVDAGDVAAMKAALQGLRAWLGILKGYDLNADPYRFKDPVPTVHTPITVDGLTNDWAGVPVSLAYYGQGVVATQEFFVALDGQQVALLGTGTLPVSAVTYLTVRLCLSDGTSINTGRYFSVDVDAHGISLQNWQTGESSALDPSIMAAKDTTVEVLLPQLDDGITSEVTVDSLDLYYDTGTASGEYHLKTPKDVPLNWLLQTQSNVLSRVRSLPSFATAEADLTAALNNYVTADTLITARTGATTNLMHLVNYDPGSYEGAKHRNLNLERVNDLRNGLAGPISLSADTDISPSGEMFYPGALFVTPITTNRLPSNLRGTLRHPFWGAFPDPTFNNFLPTMTATKFNQYLWQFQPPTNVPYAHITVDGNTTDWTLAGIAPLLTDATGDAQTGAPAGGDITNVYLAQDGTNVFVRIDVANGTTPGTNLNFSVEFQAGGEDESSGDHRIYMDCRTGTCTVEEYGHYYDDDWYDYTVSTGTMAIRGSIIEASVRLSDLQPPSPCSVDAGSGQGWDDLDWTRYIKVQFP